MEWETIFAWIDRQPWPDIWKDEARLMVKNRNKLNQNPLTGSQWVTWAKAKGLTTTIGKS